MYHQRIKKIISGTALAKWPNMLLVTDAFAQIHLFKEGTSAPFAMGLVAN